MSARGRPRSADADARIAEAALALFAERGLEGAAIDEIARRAGVTRATVYRRWATREALIADALRRIRNPQQAEWDAADWGCLDADAFVHMMLETVPHTLADPGLAPLAARLLGASRSHPELLRAYWDGMLAPRREAFARSIAAMQAAGRLPRDADPDVLQDMISGALVYRLLLSPPQGVEAWRAYCRQLLQALGIAPQK
jgi:AcrR family transcriptional regulator